MDIKEVIKIERERAAEAKEKLDTHIEFIDDDGERVTIEELCADDTEVINERLGRYKEYAEYHNQIADWLENLDLLQEALRQLIFKI